MTTLSRLFAASAAVLCLIWIASVHADGMSVPSESVSLSTTSTPVVSLYDAVANGNLEEVKACVDKGADVEEKGPDGLTPVQLAAKNGSLEIAAYLVARNANSYVETSEKLTPLHFAVMSGNKDLVNLFIGDGADVNAADINGVRPIHLAVAQGANEIVDLLYSHGAELNVKTNALQTPLHMVRSKAVAEFLILKGLEINAKDRDGRTPLHYAAKMGLRDIVTLLIAYNALVADKDNAGKTPLDLAELYRHEDAASAIREKQHASLRILAWVLAVVAVLAALAIRAVRRWLAQRRTAPGNEDIPAPAAKGVSWRKLIATLLVGVLLLLLGTAYFVKNEIEAGTVITQNQPDISPADVRPKLKRPPCFCALTKAATKGDIEEVKRLIAKGENVNEQDQGGFTPLLSALLQFEFGHVANCKEIAELLIEKGANVNIKSDTGVSAYSLVLDPQRDDLFDMFERMIKGGDVDAKGVDAKGTHNWTPLHHAVYLGWKEAVELLIGKGADINAKGGEFKVTPLRVAAEKGHLAIAELLIANGANVNAKDKDGRSPLFYAVGKEVVDLLAAKGADLNMRDAAGMLPLQHIEEKAAAEALIALGADVNAVATGGHKWTPLIHASAGGRVAVVKVLLAHGANVNAKDDIGQTAMDLAAQYDHKDCMEVLLANGALAEGGNGGASGPLNMAVLKNNLESVRMLIEKGADVNAKDGYGWTPLHGATMAGRARVDEENNQKITRLLIEKGADVNAQSAKENHGISDGPNMGLRSSPLHFAAFSGNVEVATLLMEKGANVNARTSTGVTPLHWASAATHPEFIRLLAAHQADMNAKDDQGKTPLHYGVTSRQQRNVASALIELGANVNAVDGKGATPLFYAANDKLAETLLTAGANASATDTAGATPLHYTAQRGAFDITPLLLAKKANVNARDSRGRTPLHWAAANGELAGVNAGIEMLIANGADVNAIDNSGKSPLMLAIDTRQDSTAELLRKHGANN